MPALSRLAASLAGSLASLVMLVMGASGCIHVTTIGPRPAAVDPGGPGPRPASGATTTLLSAQVLPPGPADRDFVLPVRAVVHLVFSRAIDPLTLVPQHFVLALADGRRVAPVGAFLAASGPGTQRSVSLLLAERLAAPPVAGQEPAKPPADPISVTITGLLHDIDGRVLEGLSVDVVPRTRAVAAVRAELLARGCEGRGQALRVFWSGPVHRPESGPTPTVVRSSGARASVEAPAAATEGTTFSTVGAPVHDLCVPGPTGVPDLRSLELPAGAMLDERGQPTAAGAVAISAA